jgi:hypothetical protein
MELQEAEKALCRELNLDWNDVNAGTNTLFSIADIDGYINNAVKRAWDYKPWTFTEGSSTVTAPTPTTAANAYPATFEDESIFLVIVNGVPWIGPNNGKRDFAEYMLWLSLYPTETALIWTEFARQYYLNQAAYSSGQSIVLYGKFRAPTLSNLTDLFPFSPTSDSEENSGNQAIILLAYAEALDSDKKGDHGNAKLQEARGINMLDNVWKPMDERKAAKRALHQPFFNGQDYFPQSRNTRYDTPPGNFN